MTYESTNNMGKNDGDHMSGKLASSFMRSQLQGSQMGGRNQI